MRLREGDVMWCGVVGVGLSGVGHGFDETVNLMTKVCFDPLQLT